MIGTGIQIVEVKAKIKHLLAKDYFILICKTFCCWLWWVFPWWVWEHFVFLRKVEASLPLIFGNRRFPDQIYRLCLLYVFVIAVFVNNLLEDVKGTSRTEELLHWNSRHRIVWLNQNKSLRKNVFEWIGQQPYWEKKLLARYKLSPKQLTPSSGYLIFLISFLGVASWNCSPNLFWEGSILLLQQCYRASSFEAHS